MITTCQSAEHQSMEAVLQTLLAATDSGASNTGLRDRLLALEKKLALNQLHLAVLGQMKRGKSSFINALLGADVLPAGVLPVTAIITEIKHGPTAEATIIFTTGMREKADLCTLADYITEAGNPGNRRQVASVEITYPSAFLSDGITLIDTPGIGSTHAHNTRTTESYLQHVDAGIVVLSVDPPITGVESQFIRNIQEDIPKLFFILNKTDMASNGEVSHISKFLEGELNRLRIESPEIFSLSARRALIRKREPDVSASDSSGIECFERRLRTFLLEEKSHTLVRSVALDALNAARTLRFATAIGARAQAMSADDLGRKQQALDRVLAQAEIERHDLQVLLRQHSGDLVARVEGDLKTHVEASTSVLRKHLQSFQSQHPAETGRALGSLLEGFFMREVESVFRSWRVQEDEEVQKQLDGLSRRFVASATGILERLQQAAGSLFEIPVEHLAIHCPLRVESDLYYRVEPVFYSLDSFLLVLPRFLLRPIILRRMRDRIGDLLDMNAGRIRFDYLERLQASMTQFEKELSSAIETVSETLRSALHQPNDQSQQTVATLDSVINDCAQLLR